MSRRGLHRKAPELSQSQQQRRCGCVCGGASPCGCPAAAHSFGRASSRRKLAPQGSLQSPVVWPHSLAHRRRCARPIDQCLATPLTRCADWDKLRPKAAPPPPMPKKKTMTPPPLLLSSPPPPLRFSCCVRAPPHSHRRRQKHWHPLNASQMTAGAPTPTLSAVSQAARRRRRRRRRRRTPQRGW